MRVSSKKMRTKKVNRKAPRWQSNRIKEQSMRVTIINRAFDLSESHLEAIASHMGRRYP